MKIQTIGKDKREDDLFYPTTDEWDYIESPKISIVIPIKDRYGPRVWNCLRAIQLQTEKSIETIIVDYGSNEKNYELLLRDLSSFNCIVYRYPTDKIWSPAIAKNIGIRRARGAYIATLDVDCIMEPRVIETTLKLHTKETNNYIETKIAFLSPPLKSAKIILPESFLEFRKNYTFRREGFGSYLSVRRKWWFKVRGCDERFQGWGGNDDDIRTRAGRSGNKRIRLNEQNLPETMIFHQWHPKTHRWFKETYGEVFREMKRININIVREDKTIIRNLENDKWGVCE